MARSRCLSQVDPDAELMLRLRNGDELALNALMSRWQKPLVSFIYRYVDSESVALDLAQETFVRVFESRARYTSKGKFSTWLFTIASNLARNFLRWQSRHPVVALDEPNEHGEALSDHVPSSADSPADAAERNELAAAVREHIRALPHPLKTVVLLFEYEEMGYAEIGKILGCSPKAVETRLYRARKILREGLERSSIR